MRTGVYGGSFNPPHTGHTLAAAELIRALSLDRLLVVPAADPPHKTLPIGSPKPAERLALCEAAFGGIDGVEVVDLELRREGKSYTVDTLETLSAMYPKDELFLIMGTDMFLSFSSWRAPERIAELATLAVMHRDLSEDTWQKVRQEAASLKARMNARIESVENRCLQISSTTVRRMLAFGVQDCLNPAVEAMILSRGWYLTDGSLKNLSFDRLREVSLALHDEKRRPHVIGTYQTAEALALHYGADPEAARRAGVLHDITKALGPKEQLQICEKYDMMLTQTQRENPKLLHAKTGSEIARKVFAESEAVAEAIWWHTTGRADMSLLEKIIYIADYMEPNRAFQGVETLRELVWRDLNAAVLYGLEESISYVRVHNRVVDADSLRAREFYRNHTERSQ